jgi:hypothetical protein
VATGSAHLSSPVIADVNGDGVPDVVSADLSGWLHVLDGRTGQELAGWPQPVQPRPGWTTAVDSSPTVADLDNNGHKEIIIGAGSLSVCAASGNQPGGVVAFNANGTVRWRHESMDIYNACTGGPPDGFGDGVVSTPAVGDVNGDGFPEVVWGGFDHRIYAADRFGNILPGFPIDSLDTIWDSPALYDSSHSGRMDIFIGGDAYVTGPCGSSGGGIMRDIRVVGGLPQIIWARCQNEIFQSSPAIGDLEGNGRMSMVVGTGTYYHNTDTNLLHAWHLDDGSPVPGWPVATNGPIFGSPVIGDITGAGKADVVVAACAQCFSAGNPGQVWAFRGNGQHLWNVNPQAQEGMTGEMISSPVLADLNGDGVNDVAVGMGGGLYFLRGQDGTRLYQPVEAGRVVQNSAAVANFGPGVGWRLVVASGIPSGAGRVDSFPLPQAPMSAPAWPQWRLGPTHLGAPLAPPPPPAHAGYWLAGSDGGIFAFGNAGYYGSTGAMVLNQPIVGMTRTGSGHGYWLVATDGGIFSFGDAGFHGSTGAIRLNRPIVAMAATPSGNGYWLVASDGGIFSFGDAGFYGSTGAIHLNQPIVGMSPTPDGRGYWLVASDGGIFAFGDAVFHGSTGAIHLNRPIVGMTTTANGGYRLVASDGGIFSFGGAPFYGSTGAMVLNQPIIGMTPTPTGLGYWLVASDGGIFSFGDALFFGSTGGMRLNRPIVAAAASRAS